MTKEKCVSVYLLQAVAIIKSEFKDLSNFIYFFTNLSDSVYEHKKSFRFIGVNDDYDLDIHFNLVQMMREICDGWIAGTDQDMAQSLHTILIQGGSGSLYNTIYKALSVQSWMNCSDGISPEHTLKQISYFKCLFEVSFILNRVESIEEESKQKKAA